jgi:hypothetical protein
MASRPIDRQTASGKRHSNTWQLVEQVEDRMSKGKGSAMIAVAVAFALAIWAPFGTTGVEAEPVGRHCSNGTLRGNYGGSFDGQIPAGPGTVLLRGLVVTHFDGAGNLRQKEFVTANGVPPPGGEWTLAEGTYEIGPDCTGVGNPSDQRQYPSTALGCCGSRPRNPCRRRRRGGGRHANQDRLTGSWNVPRVRVF